MNECKFTERKRSFLSKIKTSDDRNYRIVDKIPFDYDLMLQRVIYLLKACFIHQIRYMAVPKLHDKKRQHVQCHAQCDAQRHVQCDVQCDVHCDVSTNSKAR